jgi:hypothetical protein
MVGARAAPWTAVQKDDWLATRVAGEFPVKIMPTADVEHARVERFNLGI